MASLILGSIGSTLLGPIGGFIGSAIGSFIDNALFAPSPEDAFGPRLSDLSAVAADPGGPIPLVYGADRVSGTVIHTSQIIETAHKERVGGKGGGKKQNVTTYTYHVDIDFLLSEGPILGIGRIWADGRLLRGTWYQMQLDTEENFEKIGGIPYSDWYLPNMYAAADVPWSYDPVFTPTIGDQKYEWTIENGFQPITDEQVEDYLANTIYVVYAFDSASQKYLPIPASHDYTGERLEGGSYTYLKFQKEPKVVSIYRQGSAGGSLNGEIFTGPMEEDTGTPEDLKRKTETLIERWVTLDFAAAASSGGNGGLFGDDLGFQASINTTLSYGTEVGPGSGGQQDSAGFVISTPGADRTIDVAPIQYDTEEKGLLRAVAVPASDTIRWEVQTVKSLFTFDYDVSVSAQLTRFWRFRVDGPPLRDWPDYYNFYDAINDWSPKAVLQFHMSEGVALYRGFDDQISDPTMELLAGECGVPAYIGRAHIVFQRLELETFGNRIPNLTFEVVQSEDARIRNVLSDLMNRAGIDESLYDLSELPEVSTPSFVMGYSIGTNSSYRNAMEPLLEAFEIDAAEIFSQLVFRQKRRSVDYTIDYNEMANKNSGAGPETPLRLSHRDPIEMPKTFDVRYKDPEREYQTNSARFDRQVAPGVQRSVVEMPVVRQPHLMKAYARDKMRILWAERISGSWSLGRKYTHLAPSDLVTIQNSPDGRFDFTFKVTKTTRKDNGDMEMEGVRQIANLYVPAEGETDDISVDRFFETQSGSSQIAFTEEYFLDIPTLREQDNELAFYYALAGSGNNWPGATLYELVNGQWIEEVVSAGSARAGQVEDFSENFTKVTNYYSIDFENTVTVQLYNPNDELTSVSDTLFLQLANIMLVGEEIIAFKTATALGEGRYVLSTLMRARLDTEDHVATHFIGEDFVLLNENEIGSITQKQDKLNQTLQYAASTFGAGLPETGDAEEFVHTGNRIKPFSPVMLQMINGDLIDGTVGADLIDVYPLALVNGDFETGDLTGWTIVEDNPGVITSMTLGVDTVNPNDGTYFLSGYDGVTPSNLSIVNQTVAFTSLDNILIDDGLGSLNISWAQNALPSGLGNMVRLRAEFLNSEQEIIGTAETPYTVSELAWVTRAFSLSVPVRARGVRIFFDMLWGQSASLFSAIDSVEMDVAGAPLYADLEVTPVTPVNGTVTFKWARQGRIRFYLQDGMDVPDLEAAAGLDNRNFEVEIRNTSDLTTDPIRSDGVTAGLTMYRYTAAMRAADGFTTGELMYITVYHVSKDYGRGNPRTGVFKCP